MSRDPVLSDHLRALDPTPIPSELARGYHSYAELVGLWSELGLRARGIGRTHEGNPLFALELGPEDAPRASVLLAGIHPLEWVGVEVGLATMRRLAAAAPPDRRIVVFPLVNVDGYLRVEADLRAGRSRWVRGNAAGVDLNRNWPTHFRARRRSRWAGGFNYGGDAPLSEPEIAAVVGVLDALDETTEIDVAVSLHSIGQMILLPYGGTWAAPPGIGPTRTAARDLQRRIGARYGVRQSSHWIPGAFGRGMEIDHLHERYGAVTLLVECSWGGVVPWRPRTWTTPFCWMNPADPEPVASDVSRALEPLLRGEA